VTRNGNVLMLMIPCFFLICSGVPACPVGPLQVTDVRNSSAVLHWKPPADDGGRPITYVFLFIIPLLKIYFYMHGRAMAENFPTKSFY